MRSHIMKNYPVCPNTYKMASVTDDGGGFHVMLVLYIE